MADILGEERKQSVAQGSNSGGGASTSSVELERRPSGSLGLERRTSSGPADRRQSGGGAFCVGGLERCAIGSSMFGVTDLDKEFVMINIKTPFAPQSSPG